MRPRFIFRIALTAVIAAPLGATGLAAAGANPAQAGRYIVVLEDSVGDPGRVANEHSRSFNASVSHVYRYALGGFGAKVPPAAGASLGCRRQTRPLCSARAADRV